MATYEYPSSIYDRPRQLLGTLGSFWTSLYTGKDQIQSYVVSKSLIEQQSQLDLLELLASMCRYTVPIFHRDNWYMLTIRESERNTAAASLQKYDAGHTYDSGKSYDVPLQFQTVAYPAPATLMAAPHIMNRFTEPSLLWTAGVDYVLEQGSIIFHTDPFVDDRVPKRDIYNSAGEIVDREAMLWIFSGDFDWQHAYQQFGYVLGHFVKSSKNYRNLLNAVFDAIVGGTTQQCLETAIAAITGIPCVIEPVEIVEATSVDTQHLLVITNHHVYKFPLNATVIVAIGDTVTAGSQLIDAVQFYEFNRGQLAAGLSALSMGRGFLDACFYGDLVFEDKEVPLEVITDDPSGFTKLKFGLGGYPGDVAQFFDDLHLRGVLAAKQPLDVCRDGDTVLYPGSECDAVDDIVLRRGTLAHLLDRRDNPIGEPTAANLPKSINPLRFLITNILRNNAFVVKIKASQQGVDAMGLQHVRMLHKLTPPHTAMILLIEMTLNAESVKVELINESLETFTGAGPLTDSVAESMVYDAGITARSVVGTCY